MPDDELFDDLPEQTVAQATFQSRRWHKPLTPAVRGCVNPFVIRLSFGRWTSTG